MAKALVCWLLHRRGWVDHRRVYLDRTESRKWCRKCDTERDFHQPSD